MALELATGARETCTVSGNDFTLLGATNGAITFLAGITKTALTVDGSTVYCYAFESADPSTYEVMEMTYNSSSNKLVRVGTEHGSNGASAVTFDTSAGAVTIFRVLTEHDFRVGSVQVLQESVNAVTAGLVTNGSSTSFASASNKVTVTPKNASSSLVVFWSVTGDVRRDGTSGAFAQARLSGAYVNSTSTHTEIGQTKRSGAFNFPASTNRAHEFTVGGVFELDNTNYNASNNWEVGTSYQVSASSMDLNLYSVEIHVREILRL